MGLELSPTFEINDVLEVEKDIRSLTLLVSFVWRNLLDLAEVKCISCYPSKSSEREREKVG